LWSTRQCVVSGLCRTQRDDVSLNTYPAAAGSPG